MIGGYIYRTVRPDVDNRLRAQLSGSCCIGSVWEDGYVFHDNPFQEDSTLFYQSSDLIVLTQDLLVTANASLEYRSLNLQGEFPQRFIQDHANALNSIVSDFRMVIAVRTTNRSNLLLVSNRSGSGRVYYHLMADGILFCTDLRFLLTIVGFDVNEVAVYCRIP